MLPLPAPPIVKRWRRPPLSLLAAAVNVAMPFAA